MQGVTLGRRNGVRSMATTGYGICVSSPILPPPRFFKLKAETGCLFYGELIPLLLPRTLSFAFVPYFLSTMSASPCEFPPINVHFPGANSVISEIPVEWSTSPSSLIADEEQLTVRPHLTAFRLFAYLHPLESEPSTTLTKEKQSPYVLPFFGHLRRRSANLLLALVRNR